MSHLQFTLFDDESALEVLASWDRSALSYHDRVRAWRYVTLWSKRSRAWWTAAIARRRQELLRKTASAAVSA